MCCLQCLGHILLGSCSCARVHIVPLLGINLDVDSDRRSVAWCVGGIGGIGGIGQYFFTVPCCYGN